jgi:hypothetical protein
MKTKRGETPWTEVGGRAPALRRKEPHRDFERALTETRLPERPDYEAADRLLVKARREMAHSTS